MIDLQTIERVASQVRALPRPTFFPEIREPFPFELMLSELVFVNVRARKMRATLQRSLDL